jgi:Do/DeqQ family serine protease
MRTRRLAASLILIVCGFAAGLIVTGRLRQSSDAVSQTTEPPAGVSATGATGALTPSSQPDFTRVAEQTVGAVVNISSQQVVRRPNSPFTNDPFFQNFFGDADLFGSRPGIENSLGSGVIVSGDGYILTNHHVVVGEGARLARAPTITVSLANRDEVPATIVGLDPSTDLALLKIDAGNLPTIPWGDSSQLKVAEWVLAIGNPFQLNQTVTLGIVSAVGRTNVGISAYEDFIQTDAAINPGNSGGALVNARAELVGINTAIFSQSGGYQGVGFAVPSRLAQRVVSDLQQFGEVRRGAIGYVQIAPLTTQLAEQLGAPDTRGVLVQRMRRDTPAYDGGLRPGDVIVAFNGTTITDGGHLSRLIQDARIGSSATLDVIRDGRRQELRVEIERLTGTP